jgi:hypothetical protein
LGAAQFPVCLTAVLAAGQHTVSSDVAMYFDLVLSPSCVCSRTAGSLLSLLLCT